MGLEVNLVGRIVTVWGEIREPLTLWQRAEGQTENQTFNTPKEFYSPKDQATSQRTPRLVSKHLKLLKLR